MDWIEQWLGLAPDGGDGTLEAMIVVVVAMAVLVAATALTRKGRGFMRTVVHALGRVRRGERGGVGR
jgi:hypothetical protein